VNPRHPWNDPGVSTM